MPKSGIAGSQSKLIPIFLRNHHIYFYSVCTSFHFHQQQIIPLTAHTFQYKLSYVLLILYFLTVLRWNLKKRRDREDLKLTYLPFGGLFLWQACLAGSPRVPAAVGAWDKGMSGGKVGKRGSLWVTGDGGVAGGEAAAGGCRVGAETGRVDLEERRKCEDLQLAYLFFWPAWGHTSIPKGWKWYCQ